MRDLTARLRDIVRQDRRTPAPAAPVRELTYVPDPDPADPVGSAAEQLDGRALADGACIVIDQVFAGDRSHGRRRMETCAPDAAQPIHLFDDRVREHQDWSRRVVFFDIETTGLSGGAGTLAFLAGCGWFEDDGAFRIRQFFLAGPSGEHAMLQALAAVFSEASLLVTYNGRTFDVPFMETRWAFHRTASPTGDLAHFDMLPTARRFWSRRESAGDDSGCSLSALERSVLGFHRVDDVPGFEIPARYFHFLRTRDAGAVEGVLEHNRHDLRSLAVLMAHALWLAREGVDACREPCEQLALARIYARAGDHDAAEQALARAAESGDDDVRRQALAHLAVTLRRDGRHEEAADRWQQILDLPSGAASALGRRATEALAIHHEHRRKDMAAARRYAEALERHASGSYKREVERRMSRIERKQARREEKPLLAGRGS
jgi:uncharacterized protein YprB with RNaseH-like and TPR domain